MGVVRLTKPEPLSVHHNLESFSSGVESLNHWLKNRAINNQNSGASRTFVSCHNGRVVAYYALASGAITIKQASSKFRRNMPNPVPVVILARLAVDTDFQGQGIGRSLVRDAGLRVIQAADVVGIRGVLVHALSHEAKTFYEQVGFIQSPLDSKILMITLKDLKATL